MYETDADSAEPDQKPQKAESDHGLLCLLAGFSLKNFMKNGSLVRSESDCRPRYREFGPGPDPYFRGDDKIYMVILLLPLIQEGLLSVTHESKCTKYWLIA